MTDGPTLDDYLSAASKLATTLRAAFDRPGPVKRSVLLAALEAFEKADKAARA